LKSHGYDAVAFTDPVEAQTAAEANSPDLLLADVMMPRQNGVEFGIEFETAYPQCKVLLFSGNAGTANLMGGAEAKGHFFDLLAKPIYPTDLLAAIHFVLGQNA
jgi:DNA-binding response OmpR family regulator